MSLRDTLQRKVDAFASMGHPLLLEAIVLKHGAAFTGAPCTVRRATPKECFRNAARLAVADPTLRYHEGYAMGSDIAFDFLHAWVVDADGTVVDNTLREPTKYEYLGVQFDTDVLCAELVRTKHYGLLDTGVGLNLNLLRRLDSELVDAALAQRRTG